MPEKQSNIPCLSNRRLERAPIRYPERAECFALYPRTELSRRRRSVSSVAISFGKSTAHENVQAAGQRAIQLRREWLRQLAGQVKVLGMDFTHVKCKGQEKIVAVATAVRKGEPLDFALLQSESALHAEPSIRDLARLVGAEIVVTDDADSLKTVAGDLPL